MPCHIAAEQMNRFDCLHVCTCYAHGCTCAFLTLLTSRLERQAWKTSSAVRDLWSAQVPRCRGKLMQKLYQRCNLSASGKCAYLVDVWQKTVFMFSVVSLNLTRSFWNHNLHAAREINPVDIEMVQLYVLCCGVRLYFECADHDVHWEWYHDNGFLWDPVSPYLLSHGT
jgi:hypothetical protein